VNFNVFSNKFDLFHVDCNRKRTSEKSSEVFSQIIKSNKFLGSEVLSVEVSL